MSAMSAILDFLGIFDPQVALILPSKFPVNWPFSSENEGQNRTFSWCLGRAAICDCGIPWTFLLPFFFKIQPWRPSFIHDGHLLFPIRIRMI